MIQCFTIYSTTVLGDLHIWNVPAFSCLGFPVLWICLGSPMTQCNISQRHFEQVQIYPEGFETMIKYNNEQFFFVIWIDYTSSNVYAISPNKARFWCQFPINTVRDIQKQSCSDSSKMALLDCYTFSTINVHTSSSILRVWRTPNILIYPRDFNLQVFFNGLHT